MSTRKKLEKFADILQFPNVIENYDHNTDLLTLRPGEDIRLKGAWKDLYFQNDKPLVLELACGYGEYTVHLGASDTTSNYLGIDIKGNRIHRGAKYALEQGLDNVAFLRTRIEHLDNFFAPQEVQKIWITFPDPFLKKSKANRRLTAPYFLQIYRQILSYDGNLYLKTDSDELFDFSLEVAQQLPWVTIKYHNSDIYGSPDDLYLPELNVKTRYEKIHSALGKTIKFLHLKFDPAET